MNHDVCITNVVLDNTTPGIEKTRIITLTNLIRAYAAFVLSEPHRTTRNFKALLDKVGTSIFGADHRPEAYYTAASALYRLEALFRSGSIDAKYKPARYHILMAARLLASAQSPPRPNSSEMARFADELTEKFWDQTIAERLFADAVAVVDEMAGGNLHRDNIRTQPFTEDVMRRCRNRVPAVEGKTVHAVQGQA